MPTYNFDTPINRHGTDSLKFDRAQSRRRSPDLLPLWVADMDFACPREVIDAITQRTAHGIFGYTEPGAAYFAALNGWLHARYGWQGAEEEFVVTPGVVYALACAVRAFTEPGDAVLIQPPVYYPFAEVVRENRRVLAEAPLTYEGKSYHIDFAAFEHALEQSKAKLFLLCNPHNPVGRVWSEDELRTLGEICAAHHTLVVSDEIHMDFARPGFAHTSFATLPEDISNNAIVCTSASKTFNLAGLQIANTYIPKSELRERYKHAVQASGFSQANTLGLVATQAAYEHGTTWLKELKTYLEGNWEALANHLAQHTPQLHLVPAQSTYLAWIDCRALELGNKELVRFIEDDAGLWLDCGHMFGTGGEGFIRINIATQRAFLMQALEQLSHAVKYKFV